MKRRKVNKHAIRYASQKVSEGSYIYDQQYGGQNIWDPLDKRIVCLLSASETVSSFV